MKWILRDYQKKCKKQTYDHIRSCKRKIINWINMGGGTGYYETDNISVVIDGSVATIVPEYGFSGVRYMFFKVNDSSLGGVLKPIASPIEL